MNLMYFLSLDYYIKYENEHLYLYVKKVKYANYTRLLTINKDYFLSNLVNFEKLCNTIDSYISLYNKEEE